MHNVHMVLSLTLPRRGGSRASKVSGAQSIERAMALMGWIAANHAQGASLRQLVEASGLDRTTAWRIVSSLQEQGLVNKDAHTGHYHLGLEALAWGLASMSRSPLVEACQPMMKALARLSGDNVFLVVRSGDYSHCQHLEEGAHPVRSFALNVGGTRLLGLGVASIALLATLSDDEMARHYQRHVEEYRTHDVGLPKLQRWMAQTRERGHSYVGAGGVAGVGLRFGLGSCGEAAMSIIAPRTRLSRTRGDELAQAMAVEIARAQPRLGRA